MNLAIDGLTPSLFRQMVVGFDDFFDNIQNQGGYPPYNIKRVSDDSYELELAVAGFKKKEIGITLKNNSLVIEGKQDKKDGDYIHKGLSSRQFKKIWTLARHIEVKDASLEDGILKVKIARNIPEELKPKKIAIK
tara:strand:+ start:71 stop:475 length:405 start_codon:yes stop_codon:yes gene_type:complete